MIKIEVGMVIATPSKTTIGRVTRFETGTRPDGSTYITTYAQVLKKDLTPSKAFAHDPAMAVGWVLNETTKEWIKVQ